MELDRQSIERRDFPISRRGYDPAAVDAHLRALAADVEALRRQLDEQQGSAASLGSAAASQVRGILEAAESTAADIERQATADAARMRAEASADAEHTRGDAIGRAQAHVAAVAQATATLLARVESMDGEVGALVQNLQAGAGRLAGDLASVQAEMGALYDATAGRSGEGVGAGDSAAVAPVATEAPQTAAAPPGPMSAEPPAAFEVSVPAPAGAASPAVAAVASATEAINGVGSDPGVAPPVQPASVVPESSPEPAASKEQAPPPEAAPQEQASPPAWVPAPAPTTPAVSSHHAANGTAQPPSGNGGDLDGARLVALNMALNGEPREQTDRYLQENFELADRAKLLDEVYAAIEV